MTIAGRPLGSDASELQLAEMRRLAEREGIRLSDGDLLAYAQVIQDTLDAYRRLDELDEPLPRPRFAREPGWAPWPHESAGNAWAWLGRVRGAPDGPLLGLRIAVKDNIAVAGMPMTVGSARLEAYEPEVDATAVERVLAAGADILGKAACEDMCYSGGSHTSTTGPIRNPHDPARMAGGSSSGPAVLVALGEVDAALATDQGGSINIPASWCGVVGIKPTFGLVPYSGAVPVEWSIDHLGVLARDVHTAARVLDAIAGPDGYDPRDEHGPPFEPTAPAVEEPAEGLRVALLEEGFGWPGMSDERVDALVRDAVCATFDEPDRARVPLHRDSPVIMNAIGSDGGHATMLDRAPTGPPAEALHLTSLADAWMAGVPRMHEAAPTVTLLALAGAYARSRWGGRYYAKAQNLRRALRAQVDEALAGRDVLALPAVPYLPRELPPADAGIKEILAVADQGQNAGTFDLTGHPTITVPAGRVDGLPVGVMLVARRGGERTLVRAAAALETRAGAGAPTS